MAGSPFQAARHVRFKLLDGLLDFSLFAPITTAGTRPHPLLRNPAEIPLMVS
jgi:hypothetical protein